MRRVVPAKLTRPNGNTAVPRERLFQLIDQNRKKKIIWISGPAGSGKTTLASSYFDSRKGLCLWYQLDGGDSDASTFFYYMGVAAKSAFPRHRKPLPLLTPEYLLGVPVFAKRYFEQLCDRLAGKTVGRSPTKEANAAIVLDNYQDIPDASPFHDILNSGLSSITEGINVIVLSRGDPPPAFARLRAAGEMSILGWDEIRLTADESDAIAMLKVGEELGESTLTLLRGASDGWVAGLVLLLESLRMQHFGFRIPAGLPRREIFSYFASELFERSSQDIKDFLVETSFLPRMSAQMALDLTRNPKASRIFSDLNRKNYFTSRHVSQGEVFQYHPLFREFLQHRAQATMPPERLAEIRGRAASVLDANGQIEDAVSLFSEAKDWPGAIRVILTHAPTLVSQGRWQTLQGWISSFPESIREADPWLLYWLGVSMVVVSPQQSKECFARALSQFRGRKEAAGSFLALSGMLDSVTYGFDTFAELDKLIPLLDELLEEYQQQFPSPEIESRMVASILYSLVLRQPQNPSFEYWEKRGLSLVEQGVDTETALRIFVALTFYLLFTGELDKVPPVLDAFHRQVEASNFAPLSVLSLRDIEMFYHWLSADFEEHRQAAENAIALADSTGVHIFDAYFLGHSAAGALCMADVTTADECLRKMRSCLRATPSASAEALYHTLMAWSDFLVGRFGRASMHADLAIKFRDLSGSPLLSPFGNIVKAMVLHALKDDKEASNHLSEVWKICDTTQLHQAEFIAHLVEAWIAFERGDETAGGDCLRKGFALGRKRGYANAFFWVDSIVSGLCVKALEAGIETDYVLSLIRRRNLVPDGSVLHLENWPWQIRIYTLGQFGLVSDGDAAKLPGKVQQKPIQLLKCLIALGGRNVKEEHLCDALWPDAEGDLAHHSFETTLYRLRRLLGKDKAILLNEGRVSLNLQYCWVDAFALEGILDQAEELWESMRGDQTLQQPLRDVSIKAVQLTRRAIGMYTGHFLDVEAEQPWMLPLREKLRAKYVRSVQSLGVYWETVGEPERAITCYEKSLEVDDLAEDVCHRLILCHQRLGQQAKALSVYRRYRSVVNARLGVEPSSKTRSLAQSIQLSLRG